MTIKRVQIKSYEKGFYFRNGEFKRILDEGIYRFWNPLVKEQVDIVSQRSPWITHQQLDVVVKSGQLKDNATVIDLKDNERALVWINKRFARVLSPGLYALWNQFKSVEVDIVDSSDVRFQYRNMDTIMKSADVDAVLEQVTVPENQVGLYYLNGNYTETLTPGRYYFWRNAGKVTVYLQDMREKIIDVSGQDIMTADKVTLRVNSVVSYQLTDPVKAFTAVEDANQAIYREAQLALRAVIGTRELDTFLSDKDAVSTELEKSVRKRAAGFGINVLSVGIRDIILPGDMKELLNKVTEAKKVAEANLISRREEVAAMRSQANTAKMLESNPALMRLRELEVLEKVTANAKLSVVLGDKGLTDRVVNLV